MQTKLRHAHLTARIIAAAVLMLIAFMLVTLINLQPAALHMAEARARVLATNALNDAIAAIMDQNITYDDLMQVVYDKQGKVSMLQANTMRMNELGSRIVLAAQRNLENVSAQCIRVPIGAATHIALLEGSGPRVSVRMLPVGSVTTEFRTEFESAGINQIRHKIYLEAVTRVDLIAPNGAESIAVRSQISVAESLIIGDVPDSYVDVSDRDDMLNFIPD